MDCLWVFSNGFISDEVDELLVVVGFEVFVSVFVVVVVVVVVLVLEFARGM